MCIEAKRGNIRNYETCKFINCQVSKDEDLIIFLNNLNYRGSKRNI